jgi:hypothetical protein
VLAQKGMWMGVDTLPRPAPPLAVGFLDSNHRATVVLDPALHRVATATRTLLAAEVDGFPTSHVHRAKAGD